MNGKKLYEVYVEETTTSVYSVLAESEADAGDRYLDDGELVSENTDSYDAYRIEEVGAEE